MNFEEKAIALHDRQRTKPVKYRMQDNAFVDWFVAGATEAQKWNNVKDVLPTSEDYYLVFSEEYGIEIIFYNLDDKCWESSSHGEVVCYVITHWKELPNAPDTY